MHESNNANPYEAPTSPNVARSRTTYIYIMMIAVVAVVASAVALVVTRSSKSLPDKMIYMDRGPAPPPVDMPPVTQAVSPVGVGDGNAEVLPPAAP